MELLVASPLCVVLAEVLLTFIGWGYLLLLLWTGNPFLSPWSFPLLLLGERQGVVTGTVRVSPWNRRSHSVGSPSSPPTIASYEWVWNDVLKYRSSITSATSVATLEHQLRLANPEDSCKMVVQAYRSDDFPFLRAVSGCPSFFLMYYFLFEVLGLILPLNSFQCALLEHQSVAFSQLHPNIWARVRA